MPRARAQSGRAIWAATARVLAEAIHTTPATNMHAAPAYTLGAIAIAAIAAASTSAPPVTRRSRVMRARKRGSTGTTAIAPAPIEARSKV